MRLDHMHGKDARALGEGEQRLAVGLRQPVGDDDASPDR